MSRPPEFYRQARDQHPELFASYEALSTAARQAGPLDENTIGLTKLALSLASGLEGATHSATRKALDAGCTPEQIRHVVLLAVTTLGFPAMMRARSWVEDILETRDGEKS